MITRVSRTCGYCGTACDGVHFGRRFDGPTKPLVTGDEAQSTVWVDGTGGKVITPDAMDRMIRAGDVKLIGRTWSTCVIADKLTGAQITFTRIAGVIV